MKHIFLKLHEFCKSTIGAILSKQNTPAPLVNRGLRWNCNFGCTEAKTHRLLKGTKTYRVRDEKAAMRVDRCMDAKKHRGVGCLFGICFDGVCQNRPVMPNLIRHLLMPIDTINIDRLRVCLVARVKRVCNAAAFASSFRPVLDLFSLKTAVRSLPLTKRYLIVLFGRVPVLTSSFATRVTPVHKSALRAIRKPAMTERLFSMGTREQVSCAKRTEKHFSPFTFHFLRKRKRVAFTLAEVLITLGIIGVVAALTLPPLIQHHRKQVVAAQLKKFYSTMSQAVMTAQAEEGVQVSNWDTFSSAYNGEEMENWFNKYLKKHLKVIKTKLNGAYLYVYLNDGTGFCMFNHFKGVNGIHVYFYPKMKKKKQISGIDQFTFMFQYDKFSTYYEKSSWTTQQMANDPNGCHKNSAYPHLCVTVIQRNGWKIPDDYPFRF